MNAALVKLRKEKKARTLTRTGLDGVVNPDWSNAPERFATNSELGAKIKEGIAMLPEDLQAAVVLRNVEGLSRTLRAPRPKNLKLPQRLWRLPELSTV